MHMTKMLKNESSTRVKDVNCGTDLSVKKLHGYGHLEEIVVKRSDQQLYKFKEGQRVAEALTEYETQRNSVVNGDTNNTTGTGPRTVHPTRECTYKDYLNCRPLKFNGTEGVIGLTRWFERIEPVFSISNCIAETQVKFASCTLIGSALTWWNSHMRAVSQEVAYAMPWRTLKQMMTAKYCPRGEIKELEVEL
nr:hypothetical protein [Tanacetum cinerariifolium]